MEPLVNNSPPVEPKPRPEGGQAKSLWFDKKHIITYVIVLIGLIAIGGAIYYYSESLKPTGYSENCKNRNIFEVTAQDPQSNEIKTFPDCDSVPKKWEILEVGSQEQIQPSKNSDWKTYTNTTYGFEFKYPKNLEIQSLSDKAVVFSSVANNDEIISVFIKTNTKNISIEQNLANLNPKKQSIGSQISAYSYFTSDQAKFVQVLHDGSFVTLASSESKNNDLLDQILSSFKFTK